MVLLNVPSKRHLEKLKGVFGCVISDFLNIAGLAFHKIIILSNTSLRAFKLRKTYINIQNRGVRELDFEYNNKRILCKR
jgi:hypothetical protein